MSSEVLLVLVYGGAILAWVVFIFIWPYLIWSHLKEHTKYLKLISEKIKTDEKI